MRGGIRRKGRLLLPGERGAPGAPGSRRDEGWAHRMGAGGERPSKDMEKEKQEARLGKDSLEGSDEAGRRPAGSGET